MCDCFAGVIEVQNASIADVKCALVSIVKDGIADENDLARMLSFQQKLKEKFDEYLPEDLLTEGYGRRYFDSTSAEGWILDNV